MVPDSGGESVDCVVVAAEVVGAVPAAAAAWMASFAGAASVVFLDFFFFFLVWGFHISKVNKSARVCDCGHVPPAIPKGA